MYCTECGKPNPEEARFCAFCGVKLVEPTTGAADAAPPDAPEPAENAAPEAAPVQAARQQKMDIGGNAPEKRADGEPAARKVQSAAAKSVRRRPVDPSRTVVPTVENPAQPVRPGERSPYARPVKAATSTPPPALEASEPADELPPEDAPPRRKVTHRPPNKAVTASGEEESIPARRPPVKKSYKRVGEAPNTLVPDRVRQQKIDLFFDGDEDDEDDEDYEEYDEENDGKLRRRILSIVGSVLALTVFVVVFWLLATTSGQVFRASMGLSAPANAYKVYGDQLREKGNIVEAANAYYDALKLDSGNFQYALLTAQTQEIIGQNEIAEKAYLKCIELNDAASEPYRLLALLYERQGKAERQLVTLQVGYEKTQSIELKEMLDRIAPPEVPAADTGEGNPPAADPEQGGEVAPAPPDDVGAQG